MEEWMFNYIDIITGSISYNYKLPEEITSRM